MDEARMVNLTGALVLGLATDIGVAVEGASGLAMIEVAALTSLVNWADGQSIDGLREATALSQPGCARLVDRLVAAGLATKARGVDDRRVTTVSVTEAGRGVVERAWAARAAVVSRWLAGLPPEDRVRWARTVELLVGAGVDGPAEANRRCRLCRADVCGRAVDCPVTRAVPREIS